MVLVSVKLVGWWIMGRNGATHQQAKLGPYDDGGSRVEPMRHVDDPSSQDDGVGGVLSINQDEAFLGQLRCWRTKGSGGNQKQELAMCRLASGLVTFEVEDSNRDWTNNRAGALK